MIRYDRLWKTMEEKEITQYRLIKQHGFSAGQIGRLKKNMHVSTHTIETLCGILQCGVGDIIEFWPDDTPWPSQEPDEAAPVKADKPKAKKAAAKASNESDEKIEKTEKTEKPDKTASKPEKEPSKKSGKAKAEKPAKDKQPKPEKEKKAGKGKKEKSEKKNKDKKKK